MMMIHQCAGCEVKRMRRRRGRIYQKVRLFMGALRNFILESVEDDKKIKPAKSWFYQNILFL